MLNDNVTAIESREQFSDDLTALLRDKAQDLLRAALEAEVEEVLARFSDRRTESGAAGVVRSGYQPEREIQTGIGAVSVKVPKIRSVTGEPVSFRSALVPPYIRKTRSVAASVAWLYLKGVSSGEMQGALKMLVGERAKGFSSTTVSRLKDQWEAELDEFNRRDLSSQRLVYMYADGIYSGLRNEETKLCALVLIGVTEDGRKVLLAIEDGERESAQSWRELLLDLKSRGLRAPSLAVGDGALGFWSALDELFPGTRHQRCWMHKTQNVLNRLPKSRQDQAKRALHRIWMADTRTRANQAFDDFVTEYQAKYPKAAESLVADRQELLAFYDFPSAHWVSLRTTNPIESTFSTVRHRTRLCKGCLSRRKMLAMMFKLVECAETKWRRLNGYESLGKVIEGVQFQDGKEVVAEVISNNMDREAA